MYTDIIIEILKEQNCIYEKTNRGDFSDVCFLEGRDAVFGTFDKNYKNRLRLAYYILFVKKGREALVKKLFEEELKDREANSFQGIGTCLEILTFLLMKYNGTHQYDALFDRAQNANFDCACGYDRSVEQETQLEQCDIYDCIQIAIETGYPESAARLVEEWKKEIKEWDVQNYRQLILFNKNTCREAENEEPLKELLALERKNGKNRDIIAAWNNLIHFYIGFGEREKAYEAFSEMLEYTDLSEVAGIRLFSGILEDAAQLIAMGGEEAQPLWEWAVPFIAKLAGTGSMYGNLYKKSIRAAQCMKDPIEEELTAAYEAWKLKTGIIGE
ncbi:hypothetical protein [Eisenbergiella sp.]